MIHFFDIGANVGQTFTDYLQHHQELQGATVWCFEPSPRHLAGLVDTCSKFGDRFNIHVCPFGFGAHEGTVPLYEKIDQRGDSLLPEFWVDGRLIETRPKPPYKVEAVIMVLSRFIARNIHSDDSIIVKIDAEGSEYAILADLADYLSIFNISEVHVEWHTVPDDLDGKKRANLEHTFASKGKRLQQWMF